VNNVLCSFHLRGALDVRAKDIMKYEMAAAKKLWLKIAKEKVPDVVLKCFGGKKLWSLVEI